MRRTGKQDTPVEIPAEAAGRLLLHSQGLLDDPGKRTSSASLQRRIEKMGFVQIDTISTVERAHHLTLHARSDSYHASHLATLHEKKRTLFEQFTHDASYVPTSWLRYWLPRFRRTYDNLWWEGRKAEDFDRTCAHVLERIEREGPLGSRDFAHDGDSRHGNWWNWKPAKAALEFLWRTGKLAVARRINFQKVYDLMEHVHPEIVGMDSPDEEELVEWACASALERLIVATPAEIAAFWHAIKPPAARAWCQRARRAGRIATAMVQPVDGERPKRSYALLDWQARLEKLPDAPDRLRFLSPFDPVLRDRGRALRLFGFDYRFEAFVPAKQRRFGYYVLPLLYRHRFVGRADMKLLRDRGELVVKHLYWESGTRVTKKLRGELKEALVRLSKFLGAERWSTAEESVNQRIRHSSFDIRH